MSVLAFPVCQPELNLSISLRASVMEGKDSCCWTRLHPPGLVQVEEGSPRCSKLTASQKLVSAWYLWSSPRAQTLRKFRAEFAHDLIELKPRMGFWKRRRRQMIKYTQISKGRRKSATGSRGWLAPSQQSGTDDVQEGSFLKRGILSLITPK